MRICVLTASYEHSTSAFKGHDPACDPSRYVPEHRAECHAIEKSTAARQVRELADRGFDVFVNLCDGAWDEDRAGIEVVHALERLGQAFTGAGSDFYEPTRDVMKRACHYAGVRTPRHVHVGAHERAEGERAASALRFPLIVKHPNSYGSVGLTRASRVETPEELSVQLERMVSTYGAALVEEFIEGREFTVLVSEPGEGESAPRTYRSIEARFPDGETFKHFDLKWVSYAEMTWFPVEDPALDARLREASSAVFAGLDASGYGRVDLRMSPDGELFVLEINPNCGIFYPDGSFGSADEILAADPGKHRGFVEHILACALRRQARTRPAARVTHDPVAGYGLRATRALAPGDLVERWEERATHLASRAHVERTWNETQKRWFRQYAWPLSDEVFVTWSSRPDEWRPIDHSCDPNSWLEGLDLVARRPIGENESITVDYATFCGPTMEDFACRCGAPECRGTIRAEDHRAPFVTERYGAHVSGYVRSAQRALFETPTLETALDEVSGRRLVRARVALAPGMVIEGFAASAVTAEQSRHTIQLDAGRHLALAPAALRYVNHACDPNAHFDVERRALVCVAPVRAGDELTCFYPATEWAMREHFDCACGSPRCVGRVEGAERLAPSALEGRALSAFVRERAARG